jgi:hypothetical protein
VAVAAAPATGAGPQLHRAKLEQRSELGGAAERVGDELAGGEGERGQRLAGDLGDEPRAPGQLGGVAGGDLRQGAIRVGLDEPDRDPGVVGVLRCGDLGSSWYPSTSTSVRRDS